MNPSSAPMRGPNFVAHSTIGRLYHWMSKIGAPIFSFCNVAEKTGVVRLSDVDLERVRTMTAGYDRVIALGNFPSKVLNRLGVGHFRLPHPSGLNRQLNDPNFIVMELERCGDYLSLG